MKTLAQRLDYLREHLHHADEVCVAALHDAQAQAESGATNMHPLADALAIIVLRITEARLLLNQVRR